MVSRRVESVPVKVQIASGGPKLRPESASGVSKSHPEAESRARGVLRRVKMVSGRVESVPVRVQIASEGPKLRPD